jgi:hypothetical protein
MDGEKKYLTILILALFTVLIFFTAHAEEESSTKRYDDTLRVGVVGDTGIGERAYHAGFTATAKALKKNHPDLLLHLGDFAYQPKIFPQTCPERYLRKIQKTLGDPFKFKLFVPGDNDLPPNTKKPKGSGCWEKINQVGSNFDSYPTFNHKPRAYEGTMTLGNTFFAILNTYPWEDPTLWLAPRIKKAKNKGLWIIIALHEPAITTAWYLEKRDSVLKQLNLLQPDLVFSGNQHSYERFHQIGIPEPNGAIPFITPESESYLKGNGTIYVVSGGGGAFLRPFADQQGIKKRTAPKEVFNALATRALMNHFLILEITKKNLAATTYRVCPETTVEDKQNPRWKPDKPIWESVKLECNGKNKGSTVFEHFKIRKE